MKYLFIFLLFLTTQAQAQETLPITLEKVLELSGAQSLTIKEYQERQALADANVAKAKEWWLPEIYGGAQFNQLWGAAMNGNGKFFLDVNRNNLMLGLGLNANWDFAEGIYNTKAAKLQGKANAYLAQSERNNTLLESINAYYELMSAQLNLVAYRDLVEQSATIAQQIQIQVEAGLRYQSESLLAKSNNNQLKIQMLNAQKDYNTASAKLRTLLNLDQKVKLVSVDKTLLPLDYAEKLDMVTDSIHSNRPELKVNQIEIEALEMKKNTYNKGLLLPVLNLGFNSSYFGRFNGKVSPADPVTYPDPNQLYPTNAVHVSLLWKIPLGALVHDGDNKRYDSLIHLKEIEAAQVKAQIEEEVATAIIQLAIGKEQIEIAKETVDLTTEALYQSIERQKLGTAKPYEVFQAQQFFLEAQMSYLESVGAYNKAQFALKVAKGERL